MPAKGARSLLDHPHFEEACARLPDMMLAVETLAFTEALNPLLEQIAWMFGGRFAHFTLSRSANPLDGGGRRFGNFPEVAMHRYFLERAWLYDPVFTHLINAVVPRCFTEMDWSDPRATHLRRWLAAAGVGPSGLCVSVHGPCGLRASFCISSLDETPPWINWLPQAKSMLGILATCLFERVKHLSDSRDFLVVALSSREAECLDWSARGKTIAETAMILGLASTTVRHFLDSARQKLGAVTKSQAVARAQELRLLQAR